MQQSRIPTGPMNFDIMYEIHHHNKVSINDGSHLSMALKPSLKYRILHEGKEL